jgi:hypothetical protein
LASTALLLPEGRRRRLNDSRLTFATLLITVQESQSGGIEERGEANSEEEVL